MLGCEYLHDKPRPPLLDGKGQLGTWKELAARFRHVAATAPAAWNVTLMGSRRMQSRSRLSQSDKISLGLCGAAVEGIVGELGFLGLTADSLSKTCPKNSDSHDPNTCSSNGAELTAGLMLAASDILSLPNLCGLRDVTGTNCASDLLSLFGGIAQPVAVGFAIPEDCQMPPNEDGTKREGSQYLPHGRRLSPESEGHDLHFLSKRLPALVLDRTLVALDDSSISQARQHDIANCYFSAQNLGGSLAALGLILAQVTDDCKSPESQDDEASCAADITTAIGYMAAAISLSASVASTCPIEDVPKSACVANSADIVEAASIMAAFGAAVEQDCRQGTSVASVRKVRAPIPIAIAFR